MSRGHGRIETELQTIIWTAARPVARPALLGVHPNNVRRALAKLEREGLIFRVPPTSPGGPHRWRGPKPAPKPKPKMARRTHVARQGRDFLPGQAELWLLGGAPAKKP